MLTGRQAFAITLFVFLIFSFLLRFKSPPLLKNLGERTEDTTLGAAGTGLHALRIGNVAAFDLLLTVLVAYVYSFVSKGPFVLWFAVLLVVGEVLHVVYAVPTQTYTWLFGGPRIGS